MCRVFWCFLITVLNEFAECLKWDLMVLLNMISRFRVRNVRRTSDSEADRVRLSLEVTFFVVRP